MKKILVVIDMQNDFVTGCLGTEEARAIVNKVKSKVDEAHENGDYILFTQDTHGGFYMDSLEGKHLSIPHCILGSEGWELIPELKNSLKDEDEVVLKYNFGTLELPEYIEEFLYDIEYSDESDVIIELCGVCTDICVVSNALILKAAFPDIEIYVDSSACAGTTLGNHVAALTTMASCQINIL